ncbi:unnamed protein product [Spirodela intermedia]|uniref:Uncharacterized protein n=1 Tax=Spirodela intermedia TaxID=51605 RepID=A0A7I8LGK8_SPIIN|nr:unnamed protein product [Spirodela intermedia]
MGLMMKNERDKNGHVGFRPREEEGRTLQEEEPRDPRGEEIVDPNVVVILGLDAVKVEDAAKGVEETEENECGEGEGPKEVEGGGREGADGVAEGEGVRH